MNQRLQSVLLASNLISVLVTSASFAEMSVDIYATNAEGQGEMLGTVSVMDSEFGLLLTPTLQGLEPGLHGFHVHTNPACEAAEKDGKMVPGLAAGGHFDPAATGAHKGPYDNSGHLGDLPPLYVMADGSASTPMLAPRLKEADLQGRSLMIHASGDNFSDQPEALGGGGARMACGVVQ